MCFHTDGGFQEVEVTPPNIRVRLEIQRYARLAAFDDPAALDSAIAMDTVVEFHSGVAMHPTDYKGPIQC